MTRATTRDPQRSAARRRAARAAGFTLIEMLLVLSIMGVLMGISIGAFRHSIPAQALARNAVMDALRLARQFAIQENGTAFVCLEAAPGETPTVTAVGKRTVGTWHLEGEDLDGFPHEAHGEGQSEEEHGAIGKAVRLAATGASWLDFGISPSFDSPFGAACELFLQFDAPRNEPLLTKGKGFVLKSDSDGSIKLTVRVHDKDEHGDPRDTFRTVDTARPVLVPGRFAKVAASFDGMSLRLTVDDVVVAETLLVKPVPFAFDRDAPLLLGSYDGAAAAVVDEVKWAIYDGTTQELRDMELKLPLAVVRFAPDGTLDPQFHQEPAELCLRGVSVDAEQPGLETWVRIGVLGDLH
jgi:prepilin-type N-terminal cleavage/methylation domain-containing protein